MRGLLYLEWPSRDYILRDWSSLLVSEPDLRPEQIFRPSLSDYYYDFDVCARSLIANVDERSEGCLRISHLPSCASASQVRWASATTRDEDVNELTALAELLENPPKLDCFQSTGKPGESNPQTRFLRIFAPTKLFGDDEHIQMSNFASRISALHPRRRKGTEVDVKSNPKLKISPKVIMWNFCNFFSLGFRLLYSIFFSLDFVRHIRAKQSFSERIEFGPDAVER